MRSERSRQGDLFEEPRINPPLPIALRATLALMLQALLTEAARLRMSVAMEDQTGEEDGHDQDHA